jgi:pullulanase
MVQALNAAWGCASWPTWSTTTPTPAARTTQASVLDKIVPGYYHRLNAGRRVETSTCCQNTATEHAMMRKLMVDSLRTVGDAVRRRRLPLRPDGPPHEGRHAGRSRRAGRDRPVDLRLRRGLGLRRGGRNARGVNATQRNMAGTGIGTFNDRLRDAVRGGSPFGGQQEQGFITGLYDRPERHRPGHGRGATDRLLLYADLDPRRSGRQSGGLRVRSPAPAGESGRGVDYNGSPAGYTADPQENIVYVSKHDNETLFDAIQYKAPAETLDMAARVRMQNLGNSIVMLSQGVPFFQAGDDLLRSKSLDRNSYNSGDWFNRGDAG